MDGGGNMQSNEEKGAEKLMDDYLKSIGLHRKKIAKDGSCLFRAVAEQVLHCQSLHTEVRAQCVDFLKRNRALYQEFVEGDFEDYLSKLQDPQQWVGEVEINALAVMYKRDFLIFQEPGKPAVSITDNNFKDKVQLCFLNGNHYDSVYPVSHMKNAALCQSILYELLYDDVFRVDRGSLSMCQRGGRPSDLLSDDNMAACGSSDESDMDGGEPLWVECEATKPTRHGRGRGRGRQLSERVRRSLNQTLFRNIEYDVWQKSKRAQQKMDYYIAAGMQFTVGDRCQVRLEAGGRSYSATIKEVPPNNGPVTVYIEELGRKQVPLLCLRPANDEGSWSNMVSREKRLSNGHGEWEDRAKGRGRGKHTTAAAASSVSQATAPGSSGRVQKQHSWPPQATVEEKGGVKANRKSSSTVESGFGLTEEQRLAKEEEERNVALVELQLRDERSFPALVAQSGVQGDGGRKKGGEKKKPQRNKTSPVQDGRAPSPSAGEGLKSSSPTLASAAATGPTTTTTTPPTRSLQGPKPAAAPPPADSDSSPAGLRSAAAAASSSPLAAAAPTAKTNTPSAGAPPSSPPPAAAPSTKPSVTAGAVPSSPSPFSFLPPVLPAASSPPTPNALSSSSPPPSSSSKKLFTSSSSFSSSSALPPKSALPPPSSSLPSPTFIAPIAPCPAAGQGFPPTSSLTRSPLLRSPSPPSLSSSSLVHPAAHVHEAPPASAQTPNSTTTKTQDSLSQTNPQVSQTQTQASLTQPETRSSLPPPCPPHLQHWPQPQTEVAYPPQAQTSVLQTSVPQPQVSVSHLQPQSEVVLVQSSHPAPEAFHPHTTQASIPDSAPVQPQPSASPPHLHVQSAQPPHPSQVPHPSPSLSASQTPNTQHQTEAPQPPTQPQPDPASYAPPQQPHPPPPSHPSHLPSAHPPPPPHPQSILGAVPLQQLSQLYQDPLYPGFPLGEKGDMAQTPSLSSNKAGDDLPKDVNILRFFFNLGVKAYSMPMFAPYMYLLPLQQAHTMHPKFPSRSPSPQYPPSNPPTRLQETYSHPQYPPTSASLPPQYELQAPPTEPPHAGDPFNQAGYPVAEPHRMPCPSPWQQHQMPPPRNPTFPVGYPTPSPPYPVAQTMSQGYPGQGQGPPLFPLGVPPYPPSSLGYQSSSAHEEPQMSQAAMEQRQPANGDAMSAPGLGRVPGPAAANSSRTLVVPGFAGKKEQGDSLSRAVLLVDPPLNPNNPILVENPGIKDVPATMTTIKTSSSPGSPLSYNIISSSRGYRGNQKLLNPTSTYVSPGPLEPSQAGFHGLTMTEHLSVGCSTEDDWEEQTGFRATSLNHRGGPRRGRRGRGGHDPGRGAHRRRYGGEAGVGSSYSQFNPSYRGRGRERGY